MPRQKSSVPTRQLYAQIREDLYLGAKARAAEMRVPLRTFLENALEMALNGGEFAAFRAEVGIGVERRVSLDAGSPARSGRRSSFRRTRLRLFSERR